MVEPLRIGICEDTKEDEDKLLEILARCPLPTACSVFHTGEALLEAFQPMKFDLLLIDIYMGGMTGLEAVAKIREMDEDIPVAFMSTSTDHTLESYRLSALKYIEKPYREKDIFSILKLARMEKETAPCLTLQKNGKERKIPLSQILYLEQRNHRTNIYIKSGGQEDVYEKLTNLLPQLEGEPFFQCHKSYVVNLAQVRSLDGDLRCFLMSNKENVPIRREDLSKARHALEDHLFGAARSGDL